LEGESGVSRIRTDGLQQALRICTTPLREKRIVLLLGCLLWGLLRLLIPIRGDGPLFDLFLGSGFADLLRRRGLGAGHRLGWSG
jgi:hypothetical protein